MRINIIIVVNIVFSSCHCHLVVAIIIIFFARHFVAIYSLSVCLFVVYVAAFRCIVLYCSVHLCFHAYCLLRFLHRQYWQVHINCAYATTTNNFSFPFLLKTQIKKWFDYFLFILSDPCNFWWCAYYFEVPITWQHRTYIIWRLQRWVKVGRKWDTWNGSTWRSTTRGISSIIWIRRDKILSEKHSNQPKDPTLHQMQ